MTARTSVSLKKPTIRRQPFWKLSIIGLGSACSSEMKCSGGIGVGRGLARRSSSYAFGSFAAAEREGMGLRLS